MGGEKHGSKSGRYVGGFLQLFDWNAKSRKKLFSSKSDLPEQPKQGKKGEGNFPMSRIRMVEEEDYGAGFSFKGGSDYSCASSVTDEDGYGTKAPGVVARLMGLDSLPTSNASELPFSTPFFDTLSLREAPPFRGRNLDLYHHHHHNHQIMPSSHLNLLDNKTESPPRRNASETRHHKMMPNRPIEKFQAETLPPKSAKTIPITHHKLLSPIKSPIFVPSQDAAHIMEAAAKIIEPGPPPQATPRVKISSSGGSSSSVPFKVRELREKLEAAQRPSSQKPVESNAAKYLRGQPMNKSWNGGSADNALTSFRVSPSRDDSSSAVKNKGKSISLAIQAKVNVKKREGLTSTTSSSRSLGGGNEEQDDTKSTHSFKTPQTNGPKITTTNKKSSAQSSSNSSSSIVVLRQNNQKQNCSTSIPRERPVSKPSVTSSSKKVVSEETSLSRQRNLSRTGSRKSGLHARDGDREVSSSGVRNVPRKKRSIDGNLHYSNKNQVSDDNMLIDKHEKPITWIEESRRKGVDVVSFTFTAPITRSLQGSEPSRQMAGKNGDVFTDDRSKKLVSSDFARFSSSGLSGDALSILLEQKLKELTSNLESSHHNNFIKMGTSHQTPIPNSEESAIGKAREKRAQNELRVNGMSSQIYSTVSSTEPEQLRRKYNFQGLEAMGVYSNNKAETKQWNDCHLPSPVSILEPSSVFTESCYSESIASSSTEESKPCSSSVQAQEVLCSTSFQSSHSKGAEAETEVSDSASSQTHKTPKDPTTKPSMSWELGYVKDILSNVELMFKDHSTGRTRKIVNPHLFDQMERRRGGTTTAGEEDEFRRIGRKHLFDCVSECLDLKCQRFVGGGFETWAKGVATVKRKERLAEEVYKEIQGWRSLGNSNVDELVDKDMSSKYGRWLDFEVDEFMLGVEIEGEILESLVVEIVADILAF